METVGTLTFSEKLEVFMKKITIYVFCFCFVFVLTNTSYSSFYKLQRYRSSIGLSFAQYNDILPYRGTKIRSRHLGLSLAYGQTSHIKTSFAPGLKFTELPGDDIPPAPTAAVSILKMGNIEGTDFEYYLGSAFAMEYQQVNPLHFIGMDIAGYIGLLTRLKTDTVFTIIPYFGIAYTHRWINVSTTSRIYLDDTDFIFNGNAGVEIEISPTTSVIGAWAFSFEEAGTIFAIGVNFH